MQHASSSKGLFTARQGRERKAKKDQTTSKRAIKNNATNIKEKFRFRLVWMGLKALLTLTEATVYSFTHNIAVSRSAMAVGHCWLVSTEWLLVFQPKTRKFILQLTLDMLGPSGRHEEIWVTFLMHSTWNLGCYPLLGECDCHWKRCLYYNSCVQSLKIALFQSI